MRWLTAVFVAVFLGAGMARTGQLPAAVCQPYSNQWATVSGRSDVRAMERVIGSIPAGCALKTQAQRRLDSVRRALARRAEPRPAPPGPPTPPEPAGPPHDLASRIEDIDEAFDVGQTPRPRRDGEYKTAITELSAGSSPTRGAPQSQGFVNYLTGTIALDDGRPAGAVKVLNGADAALDRADANYARKLARVKGRLGEAYRLTGQPDDARRALTAANASFRGVDNYNADFQLILLDLDKRDFASALHAADNLVSLRVKATHAGVGEAWTAFAKAQWGVDPNNEPAVWKNLDQALAADPADSEAKAFAATLPRRLDGPDLTGQPSATISFNDVEAEALTCYPSAANRDDYLSKVTKEVGRITDYIRSINDYLETLGKRDQGYQARGYDFHNVIMNEIDRWRGRDEAAKKRGEALIGVWYPYAETAPATCAGSAPTRLQPPRDYDPAKSASTTAP